MDNIPIELEETQLNLQVLFDPQNKCLTMRTTNKEEIPVKNENVTTNILPNDPLLQKSQKIDMVNLENMSELERLIFEERVRLLNIKIQRKPKHIPQPKELEQIPSYIRSREKGKSKLSVRRFRERETSEEREFNKFRHRVTTTKARILQRLRNFEDETFFKEITKRNTQRIKRKRLERKSNETPEQLEQRKNLINSKSRLAKLRLKVFKTPEEILMDKEKRMKYKAKYLSSITIEERRARERATRERAKERRRKNNQEWQNVEMIIKGVQPEEQQVTEKIPVKSEIMETI